MNFRGRIGLFQNQTQARADTSPTRSFENCILCGKGEKRGVRLLDLYLSGDNHAANILSPFASSIKSKEQP